MDSEKSPEDEKLTKHERKMLKKKQKEEERGKQREAAVSANQKKTLMTYGAIALVIILLGIGVYALSARGGTGTATNDEGELYYQAGTHWDVPISIEICGQAIPGPRTPPGVNQLGPLHLHTHADGLVHFEPSEGYWNRELLTLSAWFRNVNSKYTKEEIVGHHIKDNECNNEEGIGKITLFAKGNEEPLGPDYVIQGGPLGQFKAFEDGFLLVWYFALTMTNNN